MHGGGDAGSGGGAVSAATAAAATTAASLQLLQLPGMVSCSGTSQPALLACARSPSEWASQPLVWGISTPPIMSL